jgi:hypothetical protein
MLFPTVPLWDVAPDRRWRGIAVIVVLLIPRLLNAPVDADAHIEVLLDSEPEA